MSSARQDLLRLLAAKSFRLGQFKLSSGGTSDYYIDCRTTTLAAKGARLTGQVFLDEIRARGWKPKAIGGLTMGADPIVVAVSVASGDIDGFLVRKTEKQHGTGRRIEGFQQKAAPGMPAVGVGCEICGRPAVVHNPRIRCEAHRT